MSTDIRLSQRISKIDSGRVALQYCTKTLSYGELNRRADLLAVHLTSLGVVKGDAIAICVPRSFEQVVAQLAALRSGAAFVPIDPALPDARMQHILADSAAKAFIAPAELAQRLGYPALTVDPAGFPARISAPEFPPVPSVETCGDDLAYIIYTSGSTGKPKGVEITLGNLEHLINWHLEAFAVTPADHATHLAGLGFDAAIWELWPYLSVGATISLVDDMTRVDPALLQKWIVQNGITISFIPTPIAEPLLATDWPAATKLRVLLTGGDTLHSAPIAGLPFITVNNYGPTECTVVATSGVIAAGGNGLPTIGRSIKGTSIYLLDEHKKPVLEGAPGELYIGGGGVGRGYRNLPEQTVESFLPDPFAEAGGRMYKSGDRAKLSADGEIVFLGRLDGQEKIRGNRVELDEIVSVLNGHPQISFNVVVATENGTAEKFLVAYVLPAEGMTPTAQQLREYLANSLPSYMLPSKFVRLSGLPLSINGKVDRHALPAATEQNLLTESESRVPNSELEETLLSLVRGLLKTDQIGVHDDFFLVGGHSLLGTQLVLRVRETFGVVLTLRDLFETGTVAGLAARVEELIVAEVSAMSEEEAIRMAANNAP